MLNTPCNYSKVTLSLCSVSSSHKVIPPIRTGEREALEAYDWSYRVVLLRGCTWWYKQRLCERDARRSMARQRTLCVSPKRCGLAALLNRHTNVHIGRRLLLLKTFIAMISLGQNRCETHWLTINANLNRKSEATVLLWSTTAWRNEFLKFTEGAAGSFFYRKNSTRKKSRAFH